MRLPKKRGNKKNGTFKMVKLENCVLLLDKKDDERPKKRVCMSVSPSYFCITWPFLTMYTHGKAEKL